VCVLRGCSSDSWCWHEEVICLWVLMWAGCPGKAMFIYQAYIHIDYLILSSWSSPLSAVCSSSWLSIFWYQEWELRRHLGGASREVPASPLGTVKQLVGGWWRVQGWDQTLKDLLLCLFLRTAIIFLFFMHGRNKITAEKSSMDYFVFKYRKHENLNMI
jgi:hypothetical protein